jgi:MFS family permease
MRPAQKEQQVSEAESEAVPRARQVWSIRFVLAGFCLSSLGDFGALTALTIWVHDVTMSSFAVSGLVLTGLAPLVVLGPVAGLMADRLGLARVLRSGLAAQCAITVAMAYTTAYPLMLVLVFALGVGTAIVQAGLLAVLPSLVRHDRLVQANGGLEAARSLGITLGPSLGGLLTTAFGLHGALLADAVTFLALCAAMFTLPPVAVVATDGGWGTAELLGGVRHVVRDPVLRLVLGVLSGATLFMSAVNVTEVFLAKDTLRAGDLGYGAMVGCWGLGMIFGALAAGRHTSPRHLVTVVMAGCLVAGSVIAAPAVWPVLPLALGCWLVAGVTNGAYHVAVRALIHARTPAELRGRVFAAQYSVYTAAKIASVLGGGVLVDALTPRGALLATGTGTVAVAVAGLLALRRPSPAEDREKGGATSPDEEARRTP